MEQTIYLVLQNGKVFEGKSFGATGEVTGEIVFTTAMTGYLETLTDPSYYGQIVVQTFPLIGNYGVIPSDFESSSPHLKAYIVRDWCQEPSNFRCKGRLDTFLKDNQIVGLYDIDTRELTKIIREYGVMNAAITSNINDVEKIIEELKKYKVTDAVESVSANDPYEYEKNESKYKVLLWDFGAKENIRRELIKRGCEVEVIPSNIKAEELIDKSPDGIMLSNGPGDPADNVGIIKELSKVCKTDIPIFGICLGHQLLALSQGGKTSKLKYGHRGANQPVKDLDTNKLYITSQNHGYAVVAESLPGNAKMNFINANDNTCEGIEYNNMPTFSVQFHPEAAAGPLDTAFLFDKFINNMKKKGVN